MIGELIASDPQKGCGNLKNRDLFKDKIVVMERGDCMFIDKVSTKCQSAVAHAICNFWWIIVIFRIISFFSFW